MDLELLKNAAIFAGLNDDELEKVREICQEQKFKFGQTIFKEGDKGNRLYIIAEGDVRISRDVPGSGEEALTVLKQGACFGEMAVLDRSERSTDAIANTDCTMFTITRSDFEMLLDFDRDLAYKVLWCIVRMLCERLRVTNDNLKSFLAMSMF
ncbi:MAG: cyclic nucleotide-binding domain-containing protein [Gemmatimonadales bacterium]